MVLTGGCHCRNVRFTLDWTPEPDQIPARACTCSFCAKHGGVWTACPTGSLRVEITDPAQVSAYTFGTKTADFLVCTRCGVTPVVTSRIDGNLYAVVSVNALEGVDASRITSPSPATFDAETEQERLARRKRGWIADVVIAATPG